MTFRFCCAMAALFKLRPPLRAGRDPHRPPRNTVDICAIDSSGEFAYSVQRSGRSQIECRKLLYHHINELLGLPFLLHIVEDEPKIFDD